MWLLQRAASFLQGIEVAEGHRAGSRARWLLARNARSLMRRLTPQPPTPTPAALARSELLSYVPRDPKAYESINTAGWCQFFQCALHLEVRGQAGGREVLCRQAGGRNVLCRQAGM